MIDYAGVPEELAAMGANPPRAAQVAEAIARLRSRKLPNPVLIGNAGSFFKNPVLNLNDAQALAARWPGLPLFGAGDDGMRKVSAAWLIEHAGLKGYRCAAPDVFEQHAQFLETGRSAI